MEVLKFNVEDVNILQYVSDEQLAIAEIYVCHDGDNSHGMPIPLESIKEASNTLLNKFLVADYDGYDFLDHTKTQKILGFFPSENNLRFIEKNNKTYFVANAIISKLYVPWAYDLFVNNNYKSVSMEISVLETQEIYGSTNITKFVFNGVSVLGDNVNPACEGSNAQVFKFSEDEFIENANKVYHNFAEKEITNFPKKGDNKKISLSNSNYKQFDHEYAMKLKKDYPKIWSKGGNIRGNEAFEYWHDAKNGIESNGVLDWIKEREAWMARHEGDFRIAGVIAVVKWGGVVKKGEDYMKSLINEEKLKHDKKNFTVSEDLGKLESIEIDNSKESAIMSDSWNGQGADFLNKLLKASNHNSLISESYLIVDGSGDLSVNDVHYPHHSIKNGKLVVNEKGVISAFQRAKQQGLTGEPINHLKKHYKELGLNTENFEGGGKLLDKKKEFIEKMSSMESMMNYEVVDMDDTFAYAISKEDKKTYAIPYKMAENEELEFAMEDMKKAKMACKYEMMADEEEEDMDVYMSVSKMAKLKGFNSDQNIEAVAQTEENEEESDKMKEEVEDSEEDDNDVKMAEMIKKMAEVEKENEDLKKFKADIETAQTNAKIDLEAQKMTEKVNAEFADSWKNKVSEFSTIDQWANAMKAEAFSIVIDKVEIEEKSFSRMDMPNLHDNQQEKPKKFWEM